MLKKIILILTLLISTQQIGFASNIYNYSLTGAEGEKIDLEQFKGHPLIIVNIATRCGFTGQLDDLQKIYSEYKDKGLKILAIPSNDFAGQTPEGDAEVASFCRLEYGVTFPITKRTPVIGENKHPLITEILNDESEIAWNFEKFIFDREGNRKFRFNSRVEPLSETFKTAIKSVL